MNVLRRLVTSSSQNPGNWQRWRLLIGVLLWLGLMATPFVFALRNEMRSVSTIPAGVWIVVGLLFARFGPVRVEIFRWQGVRSALPLLAGGLLLLASIWLVASEGLVPNAARFGSWLWESSTSLELQIPPGTTWFVLLFLGSAALLEGLWFRGLWFATFRDRPWLAIGAGTLLSAVWEAASVHELHRFRMLAPSAVDAFVFASATGLLFGLARARGVSWLVLAVIDWSFKVVFYGFGLPVDRLTPLWIGLFVIAFALLVRGQQIGSRARFRHSAALWAAFIFVALAPAAWSVLRSPFRVRPTTREAMLDAILGYFAEEMPKRHLDFYQLFPRAEFEAEMADFRKRASDMPDAELPIEFKRLVARLGVAHTSFDCTFLRYPIATQWFSDGVLVVDTRREYQEAIGARVVRFGSETPEVVMQKLAPFIPHENPSWLRHRLPGEVTIVSLMSHVGIAPKDGPLRLTLAKGEGPGFVVDVLPETTPRVPADEGAKLKRTPFSTDERRYSAAYVDAARALYIQFRLCFEEPGYSLEQFASDVAAIHAEKRIERVIIDLRANFGGRSDVTDRFVDLLKQAAVFREGKKPLVLIGTDTYSGGLNVASRLRQELGAILIGEPTGGKPVYYCHAKRFELPLIPAAVNYSTVKFSMGDPAAASLLPDIPVPATIEDFLASRDAALEAAFSYPANAGN